MPKSRWAIPDTITEAIRDDDRTVELVQNEGDCGIHVLIDGERISREYDLIHEVFDHLSQRRPREITEEGAGLIEEITGESLD